MTEYWCPELRWNWPAGEIDLYCRKGYRTDEILSLGCRVTVERNSCRCFNGQFVGVVDETPTAYEVMERVSHARAGGRFPDSDELIEELIKRKRTEKKLA